LAENALLSLFFELIVYPGAFDFESDVLEWHTPILIQKINISQIF
jgi:hypothetical protein